MIPKTVRKLLFRCYHQFLCLTKRVCGIESAKSLDARIRFKRRLNIKNPQNLAEKIAWLEYHDADDLKVW